MKRIIVILALLWAESATAQDSLAVYLEIAARNNPALGAEFLNYKASLERISQAGALSDPELEMGFFLKPMDILDGRQIADFRLMQMFPWFGTRRTARTEAALMSRVAYEGFRRARDELFMEVRAAWWEMVDLRQRKANVRENRTLLVALRELASSRVQTSRGGMSDVLKIEMEMAELDLAEAEIEAKITSTKARFNVFLNRDPDSPLAVPDSIMLSVAPTGELDPSRNPVLGMADAEANAYRAKAGMDRKAGLPMVGVGVQYSVIGKRMAMGIPTTAMNGRDMVMPMVSLSLPIWRTGHTARAAESRLLGEAAEERYRDAQNALRAEYIARREELGVAGRKIELYGRQTDLARRACDLAVSEFSTGTGTMSAVLEVHRGLLDYKLRLSTAIAEYNTVVAAIEKLLSEPENDNVP